MFVDAVVQCGCCNGKSPVPVEKVKGTIKTPNGEPVIGATIIEKGTTNGTITDVNGNFVLKIMNKIGELEAACVGFKKVVFKPEKRLSV